MCPLIAVLGKGNWNIGAECREEKCDWWIKQDNRWDKKKGVCAIVLSATKKERGRL